MPVNAREILIRKKTIGTDALVDKILQEPESTEGILYLKVKKLNDSTLKRNYIEASFLASTDLSAISDLLEIPIDQLIMYSNIYYDIEGFDKLSKMELLDVRDKNESLLKLWALSQGLDFLAWRLGKQIQISPVEGLQDLFTTCIYKAKEAMFNGNVTEASKESTKYVKLSMDIARLLKIWVMDSAAAKKDLEIALMEVIPDFQGLDSLDLDTQVNTDITDETI